MAERAYVLRETMSETITDYSDFDLNGPAHKAEDERIKDALVDGLLKAMGYNALSGWPDAPLHVCSQYEQEKPHAQTKREDTIENE
jgi:hypothetical protein